MLLLLLQLLVCWSVCRLVWLSYYLLRSLVALHMLSFVVVAAAAVFFILILILFLRLVFLFRLSIFIFLLWLACIEREKHLNKRGSDVQRVSHFSEPIYVFIFVSIVFSLVCTFVAVFRMCSNWLEILGVPSFTSIYRPLICLFRNTNMFSCFFFFFLYWLINKNLPFFLGST